MKYLIELSANWIEISDSIETVWIEISGVIKGYLCYKTIFSQKVALGV